MMSWVVYCIGTMGYLTAMLCVLSGPVIVASLFTPLIAFGRNPFKFGDYPLDKRAGAV